MGNSAHRRIRQSEVQSWVAQLKLSASSVAHAQTVLAGILDDAVSERRLATNPARGVKLPAKRRPTRATTRPLRRCIRWPTRQSIPTSCCCWRRPVCGELKWPRCACVALTSVAAHPRRTLGVESERQDDHQHHQDARGALGRGVGVAAQAVGPGDGRQESRRIALVPGRWTASAATDSNTLARCSGQTLPGSRCEIPSRHRPRTTPHGGVADDRLRGQRPRQCSLS
jgi:hypothetical protein